MKIVINELAYCVRAAFGRPYFGKNDIYFRGDGQTLVGHIRL